MTTKLKVGMLALLVVVSSGAFAASASITGSVDRNASVDVVTDDAGLISIQDGASGGLVYQNSSDALTVDFTNGSAQGVSSSSHFEIGDSTDANNTYAFNVTNQGTDSHSFTFDYSQTTADSDTSTSNIQFQVYDDTGASVGTADEEGNTVTTTSVAPGTTFYVVIVVDTHGLDSTDDLSGTLNIAI